MAVQTERQTRLLKEGDCPLCHGQGCRHGHDLCAERMCHLDSARNFGIVALVIQAEVEGEDANARSFEFGSVLLHVVEPGSQSPGAHSLLMSGTRGRWP